MVNGDFDSCSLFSSFRSEQSICKFIYVVSNILHLIFILFSSYFHLVFILFSSCFHLVFQIDDGFLRFTASSALSLSLAGIYVNDGR